MITNYQFLKLQLKTSTLGDWETENLGVGEGGGVGWGERGGDGNHLERMFKKFQLRIGFPI